MSSYYIGKRNRNIFTNDSSKSFKVSRSKVELFIECPRCFYLDRKLGISRPPAYPFTLNNAVDALLKKEFDLYRTKQEVHPLVKSYGIDAVPAANEKLNTWRNSFAGIRYLHTPTNLLLYGAIDDLWQHSNGEYSVVDYKATSKNEKPTLDGYWQQAYKRQMEVYQWLLRHNGFDVSDTGYFVYVNGRRDRKAFDGKLEFDVDIIQYDGDDSWVEKTLLEARKTLKSELVPETGEKCEYCPYREFAGKSIRSLYGKAQMKKDPPKKETLF